MLTPPYTIESIAPAAPGASGLEGGPGASLREALPSAPTDGEWMVRLRTKDGISFIVGVRPLGESKLEMDEVTAPIVAADLLRLGWLDTVRPIPNLVLRSSTLYRGFRLERPITIGSGAGERWALQCLAASDVAEEFDWAVALRTLDAFAGAVFGEDRIHA